MTRAIATAAQSVRNPMAGARITETFTRPPQRTIRDRHLISVAHEVTTQSLDQNERQLMLSTGATFLSQRSGPGRVHIMVIGQLAMPPGPEQTHSSVAVVVVLP
jgi:hypothetical protein